VSNASRTELIALITKARHALIESQRHWSAVVGLSGDHRYQRQGSPLSPFVPLSPPNTSTTAQAACPVGKKVIGGAASIQGVPSNATTIHTNLTLDRFYDAHYANTSTQPRQLNSVAICATVSP
jgi:hypothetical protein